MVRPERRADLAGENPVRVSAGAPGSRLQPGGEIRPCRAECRKPFYREGEQTNGPQQSVNAIASSEYQPKGVWESRTAHVTVKATDNILGRNGCGSPRGLRRWHVGTEQCGTGETLPGSLIRQDWAYKVGRLKVRGAGRESERSTVPGKACKTTRWREGALL